MQNSTMSFPIYLVNNQVVCSDGGGWVAELQPLNQTFD